jgi:probable HAF family extracellular repeat protein
VLEFLTSRSGRTLSGNATQRGREMMKRFGILCLVILGMLFGTAKGALATTYTYTTIMDPNATVTTAAEGINNLGQIVGTFQGATGEHGFLYNSGTYTTLPDNPLGDAGTTNYTGINNNGDMVGTYNTGVTTHSFVDIGGTMTTIDVAGALATFVRGINNTGQVSGEYIDSNYHGFIYDIASKTFTLYDEPNAATGRPTLGAGINDSSQVVGAFDTSTSRHGYSATGVTGGTAGTFTTIDDPNAASNTEAFGINNLGQIVGNYVDASNVNHGFLDAGGTFTTIDDPSGGLNQALGINDNGAIVGFYETGVQGGNFGFLATPVALAPEPGSISLLGVGLAALVGFGLWKKGSLSGLVS